MDPKDPPSPVEDDRSDAEIVASFTDRGSAAADRVRAVDRARPTALGRPVVMQALITVLADASDDPDVRRAAQGALSAAGFATAEFAPYDADYRSALRTAASSSDRRLADRALESLTLRHDDYAQSLVVDGLADPGKATVDRLRALQFLGYDMHSGLYPLLREVAEGTDDPEEQAAAVRLLAADGSSADLFRRLLGDRDRDPRVRAAGAIALNSVAPREFRSTAPDIIRDTSDDDDVRASCLTALSVTGPAADRAAGAADLADAVLDADVAPSAGLARAARSHRELATPDADD